MRKAVTVKIPGKKWFSRLLPWLLTVLTVGAGFGISRAASLFLPDYTGQVYMGQLEQGGAQAFFLNENDQVALFPWDQFHLENAVTLQDYIEGEGLSSPWNMITAYVEEPEVWEAPLNGMEGLPMALALWQKLITLDTPASSKNWSELICFATISGVPMVCLPDTVTLKGLSLGFAADEQRIYYFKRSSVLQPAESEAAPLESGSLSQCIVEAQENWESWHDAMVQEGLFSVGQGEAQEIMASLSESSLPSESPLPTDPLEASQAEGSFSSTEGLFSSQLPETSKTTNALLSFLEQAANVPASWLESTLLSNWYFLNEQNAFAENLAQLVKGDYSTLSRNGETLVAFSGGSANNDTVVFFYDEAQGVFTGYSANFHFSS